MLAAYFMSGVRPMEIIVQFALREQTLMFKLHNYFRMAELLQNKYEKIKKLLTVLEKYVNLYKRLKNVGASRVSTLTLQQLG